MTTPKHRSGIPQWGNAKPLKALLVVGSVLVSLWGARAIHQQVIINQFFVDCLNNKMEREVAGQDLSPEVLDRVKAWAWMECNNTPASII